MVPYGALQSLENAFFPQSSSPTTTAPSPRSEVTGSQHFILTLLLTSSHRTITGKMTISFLVASSAVLLFAPSTSSFLTTAPLPLKKLVSRPSPLAAEPLESGSTVVVCTGPTCSKTGSKKTLPIFKQLGEEMGINIETFSCVSDCAECGLGPNVEVRKKGDDGPFYPIKNGIKTEEDVRSVLGIS
ncbi:hypothetical protein ACHAW6_013933 [Cyclotella cf. meneghiniana]